MLNLRSSHSRIGLRLRFAFSILLTLLLVQAGIALYRLRALSSEFESLVQDRMRNLGLSAQIGIQADAAARKLSFLLSADRDRRLPVYAQMRAADRHLDQVMEELGRRLSSGEGQLRFQAVQARLLDYRDAYRTTIERIEADDLQGARRAMVEDTDETLTRLARARDELDGAEQAQTRQNIRTLDVQLQHDRQLVLVLCVTGLTLGALFSAAVTRGIVRPLLRTEAAALQLANGDFTARIPITTQDEVGRVSAALNTLAAAVGERETRLQVLAHTDPLTGLGQRLRFINDGGRLIRALTAESGCAALFCFDVDRLKTVNAVLGFDAGDAVIVDAASRLAAVFGPGAILSRLAGGTFAALLPVREAKSAFDLANALRRDVEHKVAWNEQALDLAITSGFAIFPDHAAEVEPLLRRAEQAMFEAKRTRSAVAVYTPALEASRMSHLSLLSDLQDAVEQGQLRQFLQPKLTPSGRLQGAEALVRWHHPRRGWVPPNEFVPFAERTGRIRALTDWMLERAAQTLARWQREGIDLTIAVNVSTRDIQDASLPERVRALLERYRVQPNRLQMELTETGLMESGRDPVQVLDSLRALGVWLAIDDFGTGQSSLAYLQRLPMNELKIDRCFVQDADADEQRGDFLGSIVRLGHSLGLRVTAEGAETPGELAVLQRIGCDLVQGYVFAKPMDTCDFEAWREQRSPHAIATLSQA